MPLGDSLQKYTYQYLLQRALSQVPDNIDKREGSIIYDALAPACYVLAEYFMEVHRLAQEVSIETASGEWLDNKVLEVGLSRNVATPTVKKAVITMNGSATVPIGSRFATVSEGDVLYFTVTAYPYIDEEGVRHESVYEATCETPGSIGNHYKGTIVPLDYISNFVSATLEDYIISGRDAENDEELRERYLSKVRYRAFGGNVAQYREMVLGLTLDDKPAGIGGVQVYPTWNGGGTVKLSIVGGDLLPVTSTFLSDVQRVIDPDHANTALDGSRGLGTAPIDHRVTVVTPEQYVVDITADVYLSTNKTIDQARPQIVEAIEQYFAQLRADWDNASDLNEYTTVIYQSQIVRAALSVPEGVSDFSNVKLKKHGTTQELTNITLTQSGDVQQLPILGTVTLNVRT